MFETKIAIVVRDDLAVWQKLNVTAFLASGIAARLPETIGQVYTDAADCGYTPMFRQPVLVFAATADTLQRTHTRALSADLVIAPYIEAMFSTGHDAANRAVFAEGDPAAQVWAGLGLCGPRKAVDKAVKGLKLHG